MIKRLMLDSLDSISETFNTILDLVVDQGRYRSHLIFVSWFASLVSVLVVIPIIIISAAVAYPFYVFYKICKGESWSRF